MEEGEESLHFLTIAKKIPDEPIAFASAEINGALEKDCLCLESIIEIA